jgi:hypothetical protein
MSDAESPPDNALMRGCMLLVVVLSGVMIARYVLHDDHAFVVYLNLTLSLFNFFGAISLLELDQQTNDQ